MDARGLVFNLLEHDLLEWAEDASLRLVWADLLQLHDDPIGQLVVLDHLAATAAKADRGRLTSAAEALREALESRLWSAATAEIRADPGVRLSWELGFVRELKVNARELKLRRTRRPQWRRSGAITSEESVEWLIPLLMREPAMRFVECVRIDIDNDQASSATSWMRDGGLRTGCLREVHVGRPARTTRRPAGQWESGGSLGVHAANRFGESLVGFRRLRRFSVGGEMMRIPCCAGASQTREHHVKRLPERALTSPNRAALACALWDASSCVHLAAFTAAASLGPRAAFLLDDLIWFLRPPLSRKDPRPGLCLDALAAIGPASRVLLREVIGASEALLSKNSVRREALLRWFIALGPLAREGSSIVEQTLSGEPSRWEPESLRETARRARKAIAAGIT